MQQCQPAQGRYVLVERVLGGGARASTIQLRSDPTTNTAILNTTQRAYNWERSAVTYQILQECCWWLETLENRLSAFSKGAGDEILGDVDKIKLPLNSSKIKK